MSDLVNINVTIPADRVGDVYAYVARLIQGEESPGAATLPKRADARAKDGFGRATVKKNYLGGVSDYWRPFLEALADEPDQWVAWVDLCESIDLTPQQASGMLGAAERRCKLKPPYEKAFDDGEYWFRMPADVADIINELAEARSGA